MPRKSKSYPKTKAKKKTFQKKVKVVMEEFSKGGLHSGKSKKIVTNPKQAIAIALSSARDVIKKKKKVKGKKKGK